MKIQQHTVVQKENQNNLNANMDALYNDKKGEKINMIMTSEAEEIPK